MKKIKVADIIIFLVLLALGIYFLVFYFKKKSSNYVSIKADGKDYIYPLDKDEIYTVEGALGPSVIEVKDGKVRFLDSTCPNLTCVALSWGRTLVCLPNDVIVQVEGESGDEREVYDEISF